MDAHLEIKENDQGPADALTPAEETNDHEMAATQPIEWTNATGTHLDHLNDDCLLEIFSEKSLAPADLCALAETCKLFKRITQRVFPKIFTVYYPDPSIFIRWKDNESRTESAHNVERILKNFGRCFVALKVKCATFIMSSVAKHCVAGTLKELQIANINFTEVMAVEVKSIFQQLQKLTIDNAPILCGGNVFANCDSLIELRLIAYGVEENRHHPIMENNYPELQRFIFDKSAGYVDFVEMLNFLERHKTLKCLHLAGSHYFNAMEDFFPKLGNSCTELEELKIVSFEYRGPSTLDFSNFQSLKRLKVAFHHYASHLRMTGMHAQRFAKMAQGYATSVRLQNAKSIEVLEIDEVLGTKKFMTDLQLLKNLRELHVNLDALSETVQWTSLPQLTKLWLTGVRHVTDNVVGIIRQLSNLEELKICWKEFVLSEKEFCEIVQLTKRRQNVLTLTCKFIFSQYGETYEKLCEKNSKVKLIKLQS